MVEDFPQPPEDEQLLPAHVLPDTHEVSLDSSGYSDSLSTSEVLSEEESTPDINPPSLPETAIDIPPEAQSPQSTVSSDQNGESKSGGDEALTDLAERLGSDQREMQQKMAKDLDAAITYGLATIKNKHEFGEELSLSEKAFESICNFVERHPEIKSGRILLDHSDWDMALLKFEHIGATIADDLQAMTPDKSSINLPRLTFTVEQIQPTHNNRYLAWEVGPSSQAYFIQRNTRYEEDNGHRTVVEELRTEDVTPDNLSTLQQVLDQLGIDLDQHQVA